MSVGLGLVSPHIYLSTFTNKINKNLPPMQRSNFCRFIEFVVLVSVAAIIVALSEFYSKMPMN